VTVRRRPARRRWRQSTCDEGVATRIGPEPCVVGFDIDGASRRLDLTTLETIALATKTTKGA